MGVASSVSGLAQQIRESIQQEGVWNLAWRLALAPVVWSGALRAGLLDDLPGPAPAGSAGRMVTKSDVDDILLVRPSSERGVLHERFQAGHECVLATLQGEPAAFAWLCTGAARLGPLSLPLEEGEVWVYDSYTAKRFRREGMRRAIMHGYMPHFLQRGFRRHMSCATLGRRPWGRDDRLQVAAIRTLRLGPFRRISVEACGTESDYWQQRLKELRWA